MRVAAWVVIAPLLAYLVFIGGGYPGINYVALRLLSLGLTAIVLVAWFVAMVRSRWWRPTSGLWPVLLVVFAAFTVSTIFSRNQRLSAESLAYLVVSLALYLLLQRLLSDDFFRPRMVALAGILSLMVAVAYLGAAVIQWVDWWGTVGQLTAPPLRPAFASLTYGNPNPVAFVAVTLMATGLAGTHAPFGARRFAVATITVLGIAVVVVSGSRLIWVAAVLAALSTLGVWTFTRRRLRLELQAFRSGRWVLAIAVTGILLIAALPGVAARLSQGGGGDLRVSYLAASSRLFLESPVVGSGPGTWGSQRATVAQPDEDDVWLPHAHNIYAEALAEFGLLGVLAGFVVLGKTGQLIRRAVFDADIRSRRVGYAAMFTTIFYGIAALGDIATDLPAVLFAAALPIAWLDAEQGARAMRSQKKTDVSRALRRVGVLALACASSAALLVWIEMSTLTAQRATDLAAAGDAQGAYEAAQEAASKDPDLPVYDFLAGLTAARVGDKVGALAAFTRSASADDFPEAWLNVAAIQIELGKPTDATASLDRALRLGYQRATIAIPAGGLWLELSERQRAIDAFAKGVIAAPSLASDANWLATPEIAPIRSEILESALASAPLDVAFRIAVEADQLDRATAVAAQLTGSEATLDKLVVGAWSGNTPDWDALLALAQSRPLDTRVLAWCERVSQHLGRWEEARRYGHWLSVVDPAADAILGEVLRITTSTSAPTPWSASGGYGAFVYRRQLPGNFGVPGLLGIDGETCVSARTPACE